MKICFSSHFFCYDRGVGKYAVNLVKHLSENHDITLVASHFDSNTADNVKVVKYDVPKFSVMFMLLSARAKATKIIKKLDEKEKFDVIHTQGESSYHDVVSLHSCYRSWIDDVRKEKGTLYTMASRIHPTTRVILGMEKKYMEGRHKKFLAVSQQVKDDMLRYYKVPENDIEIVHPGLALSDFHVEKMEKEKIRNDIRKRHDLGDERILLVVGQALYKKGIYEVIKAMKGVDAKVLVVGSDDPAPYRNAARKSGVVDKFVFAGKVPVVSDYYHAADAFVFPARRDPFPIVIAEAIASGLPVVASAEAGTTEILKDGRDALIVKDPRDFNSLHDKISELVSSDSLRDRLVKNGLKSVEQLDWPNITKKIEDVYRRVSE